MNINIRNIETLNNSGNELIKVATSLLILGIAFILFNGRRTLKFLRALRFVLALIAKNIANISIELNNKLG